MPINLYNYLRSAKLIAMQSNYSWSSSLGTRTHVESMWNQAESLYEDTAAILDELAYLGNFKTVWPRCRVWFPLQFRLCAEQVMWDRGGEWRRYVTGFKPVTDTPGSPIVGGGAKIPPPGSERTSDESAKKTSRVKGRKSHRQ